MLILTFIFIYVQLDKLSFTTEGHFRLLPTNKTISKSCNLTGINRKKCKYLNVKK